MIFGVKKNRGRICRSISVSIVFITMMIAVDAAGMEPGPFTQNVFHKVFVALEDSRESGSPAIAREVINERLAHHIAFETIARQALREHWTGSSEDDRLEFLYALKGFVIDSYARLLARANAIEIDVDKNAESEKRTANLSGRLLTDGTAEPVELRLIKIGKGWRLFDVTHGGERFSDTFRNEFASLVELGGIAAVTAALNQRGLASVSPGM